MFHGCLMRGIPIIIFCIIFIACVVILLCFIIIAIKSKNKQGFKGIIIKEAFSDLLIECSDILCILAMCFVLMVIIVPISYSKKHAFNEAYFYYEKCITLSEEINEINKEINKESISEELKSYNITFVNKKMEEYKKMKREFDYWYERTNK